MLFRFGLTEQDAVGAVMGTTGDGSESVAATLSIEDRPAFELVANSFYEQCGVASIPGTPDISTRSNPTLHYLAADSMSLARGITVALQATDNGKLNLVAFIRSIIAMHLYNPNLQSMIEEALRIVVRDVFCIQDPKACEALITVVKRI